MTQREQRKGDGRPAMAAGSSYHAACPPAVATPHGGGHAFTVVRLAVHNGPVIALRLARAAVTAAAGAVVALAQLHLPSERFWDGQAGVQWVSVAVLAIFICYDAVRAVNYAVRAARIREYDNDVRAALSAVIGAVVDSTGVPWDEISVRYYRRRGLPWLPSDRAMPLLLPRLVPVAAVQAGADLAEAAHPLLPGEGVAGLAFADQITLAEQWRSFVRTATEQGPAAWAERPARARYGLTWGQLRRSARPEGMVASPTFDATGRPDGCILVSGPVKMPDLTSDNMRQTLDDFATVIDCLGPPPPGWWGAHER